MQDDFDFLNGVNSLYKKDMCISPVVPLEPQLESTIGNNANNYIENIAAASILKVTKNDDSRAKDIFSNHPSTWKLHPINGQEHSQHRLQNDEHHHEQRHHYRLNVATNKLLLQNSDDPLISHGANNVCAGDDDSHLLISTAQNDESVQMVNPIFNSTATIKQKPSTTRSQQLHRKLPQNGCSLLTKQQLKVKAGLMSIQNRTANDIEKSGHICTDVAQTSNRLNDVKLPKKKGVLKLRFHHQALPPEYLIHYEATQGQLSPFAKESKAKSSETRSFKDHTSKQFSAKNGHENIRSWLQKITAMHRPVQRVDMEQNEKTLSKQQKRLELPKTEVYSDTNNNYKVSRMQPSKSRYSKMPVEKSGPQFEPKLSYNCENDHVHSLRLKCAVNTFASNTTNFNTINAASLKRVINFADLPYMGEITLDNSKPRRGRKPKKADICHLIYKNYGTILPGRTFIKELNKSNSVKDVDQKQYITDDLPLNLCIRDQQCEVLSISSGGSENVCGIGEIECINTVPSVVENFLETELSDVTPVSDLKEPVLLKDELNIDTNNSIQLVNSFSPVKQSKLAENHSNDNNLHPISLYYQKLLSGTLENPYSQPFGLPVETIEKDNQLTLKIPIPSGLIRKSITKNMSQTLNLNNQTTDYPDLMSTPSSIKSEHSSITATPSESATTTAPNPIFTSQKRKRSAIFIPPIPTEITTNTPTEVSICKFKFTGGDKPSLEEKKMLSVDSGGNYRYYSGTGDKSTRGYEYFPRESLQNSAGFLPGVNCVISCSNSENECSINDVPPPSAELSNEILQIPESPTTNLLLPASVSLPEVLSPLPTSRLESARSDSLTQITQPQKIQIIVGSNCIKNISTRSTSSIRDNIPNLMVGPLTCNSSHPKKKSRRSTEREKLEKTFKEKGFLIQTQQLESAEGATYCKFRQLKKFTRYLFRNWKDYLPEEVHQTNVGEETFLTSQILTKNEIKKEKNTADNFTDQEIQHILERHGFLSVSEVCSPNSVPNNTSNLTGKILPEQKLSDNTAKT